MVTREEVESGEAPKPDACEKCGAPAFVTDEIKRGIHWSTAAGAWVCKRCHFGGVEEEDELYRLEKE